MLITSKYVSQRHKSLYSKIYQIQAILLNVLHTKEYKHKLLQLIITSYTNVSFKSLLLANNLLHRLPNLHQQICDCRFFHNLILYLCESVDSVM
jgi:hydrogenase-4 membrane subunit HyfE